MSRRRAGRNGLWQIFRAPLLLAAISAAGLIAALLVDGPIDLLWALAVAMPLTTIAFHLTR